MPLDAAGITQAIGVAKGQALKIIGGIPILKNMSGSTLEKLKIPKHIDPGNIKGLLTRVMSGGLGSVMQNPLASAQSQLNSTISSATSQLSGLAGSAGVISAMGNLQSSVSSVASLAGNMSGVTSSPNMPDVLDLMGHVGNAQGFGSSIPAALSIDTVMAPINMGPPIVSYAQQISSAVLQVVQGTMSFSAAANMIQGFANNVATQDQAARDAITTLQASASDLMAVQVAVASQIPGALPDQVRIGLRAAIRPDVIGDVDSWINDRNAAIVGPPTPSV